jgi:putative ABC transport system permease protein
VAFSVWGADPLSWRDLLYLIRRNLTRMKMRVAMTATGVVIGTTAVILLVSLGIGLQRFALQDIGSIGELTEINVFSPAGMGGFIMSSSGAQREQTVLNDRTLNSFRDLPGVVAVTPMVNLRANASLRLNQYTAYASIVGLDPREIKNLGFETSSGMARLGKWQAFIGSKVASTFMDPRTRRTVTELPDLQGQTLQLTLTKVADDGKVTTRQVRVRITGILEPSGSNKDYSLYLALNDVMDLNNWASGRRINLNTEGYDQVLVKLESPQQVLPVEQNITQRGFPAYSAQSTLQSVNQLFLVIQLVLGGIGGVALLVAGVGIANAMIMAIYERTREIGLMKAIGARNRDVMFVFLGEAGAIGTLGGAGGALLGWLLAKLISLIGGSYIAAMASQSGATDLNVPALAFTPVWLLLFAILFSTFIGIVSGVYPALRATRLDPIAALRYE